MKDLRPPAAKIDIAIQLLNQGHPLESERVCNEIIQGGHADATTHHILALSYRVQGKVNRAAETLQNIIQDTPANPAILNSYGLVLLEQSKVQEAVTVLKRALEYDAHLTAAHANLGHANARLGNLQEAEDCYKAALKLNPQLADALVQLAFLLSKQNRLLEIIADLPALDMATQNDPGILLVYGLVAMENKAPEQGEKFFRLALQAMPQSAALWGNLGLALAAQRKTIDARAAYKQAIAIDPTMAEAMINLADTLKYEQPSVARKHLLEAERLSPTNASALDMIGYTWFIEGELDNAINYYDKALANDPRSERAAFHKACIYFIRGEFAAAWPLYKIRYAPPHHLESPIDDNVPVWSEGTEIGSRTLIWTDQGIGDEILQLSLIADLYQKESPITLATEERLLPIVERSFPGLNCVGRENLKQNQRGAELFDTQSPAILLAQSYRKTLDDFPSRTSYLVADPHETASLKEKYSAKRPDTSLIGISWKSSNVTFGESKSLNISQLMPVLRTKNYTFVVLQYGEVREDIETLPTEVQHRLIFDESIDPLTDLDGFASQVAAMDAVLTTSNTTAHMAGALGVPTWTLVPKVGSGWLWYWFAGRPDSPWYQSINLRRQAADGTWSDAITQTAQEMSQFLEAL